MFNSIFIKKVEFQINKDEQSLKGFEQNPSEKLLSVASC